MRSNETDLDEFNRLTVLRTRVRELTRGHIKALDEFHVKYSDVPRDHQRRLEDLSRYPVAVRGFTRDRYTLTEDRPLKAVSTAACFRSLLRNPKVDFRNLVPEEMVFGLFELFVTNRLGPSGLEPVNTYNASQLIPMLDTVIGTLTRRLREKASEGTAPGLIAESLELAERGRLRYAEAFLNPVARPEPASDTERTDASDNSAASAPRTSRIGHGQAVRRVQEEATWYSIHDRATCPVIHEIMPDICSWLIAGSLAETELAAREVRAQLERAQVSTSNGSTGDADAAGKRVRRLERNTARHQHILELLDSTEERCAWTTDGGEVRQLLEDVISKAETAIRDSLAALNALAQPSYTDGLFAPVGLVDQLFAAAVESSSKLRGPSGARISHAAHRIPSAALALACFLRDALTLVLKQTLQQSLERVGAVSIRATDPYVQLAPQSSDAAGSAVADSSDQKWLSAIEYRGHGYLTYWATLALHSRDPRSRDRASTSRAARVVSSTAWALRSEGPESTQRPLDPATARLADDLLGSSLAALEHEYALVTAGLRKSDPFSYGFHLAAQLQFNRHRLQSEFIPVALERLFELQSLDGLWAEDIPVWVTHRSGEFRCSTYELLSSILVSLTLVPDYLDPFLENFERAVSWLEHRNRDGLLPDYTQSGVLLLESTGPAGRTRRVEQSLDEMPQAWVTAEAYTFLHLLDDYVSARINDTLLRFFSGRRKTVRDADAFKDVIGDINLGNDVQHNWVKLGGLMQWHVAEPLKTEAPYFDTYSLRAFSDRALKLRAGVLYGPPGTGKTTIVERLARYLGWPLISLDPSDFAGLGLASVPARVSQVFDLLREAEDVVILFDEMEEMMRTRGGNADLVGTYEQRIWTTCFLPRLQDLYDRQKSIYFVATNHLEAVDAAVRRLGRFDFRLRIDMPSVDAKLAAILDQFSRFDAPIELADALVKVLGSNGDPRVREELKWITRADALAVGDELRARAREVLPDGDVEAMVRSVISTALDRVRTSEPRDEPGNYFPTWLIANEPPEG